MRTILLSGALSLAAFIPFGWANDIEFIGHVSLDDSILEHGMFTEHSLPTVLAAAYEQKKLAAPEFRDATCLKAQNLLAQGGFSTQQLFRVTSTCVANKKSSFIIKEATNGLIEAIRLEAIKRFPGIAPIAAPKKLPEFPSLALPLAFLSYLDDGVPHYLSIMPAAKGNDFCSFILEHKQGGPVHNAAIRRAYYALGRSLANFQQAFKVSNSSALLSNTLVHSDLKCLNVFYDMKSNHFTFIDNETMEDSLVDPSSPANDIEKILFGNLATNESVFIRHLLDNVNLSRWYRHSFTSFMKGYLSVFPKEQRPIVLKEFKAFLNKPFQGLAMDYDEAAIETVRKKYLRPILDMLIKTQNRAISEGEAQVH